MILVSSSSRVVVVVVAFVVVYCMQTYLSTIMFSLLFASVRSEMSICQPGTCYILVQEYHVVEELTTHK